MNIIEKRLTESLLNLFQNSRSKLGIVQSDVEETSHNFEAQWNSIEYSFMLKVIDSAFTESLTSAFRNVHSYKYLDDPTFAVSLEKRMTATGIPKKERQKALNAIEELKKEYQDTQNFEEKSSGWNINLDEIADMTRNANSREYENTTPFTGGGPAPKENEIK